MFGNRWSVLFPTQECLILCSLPTLMHAGATPLDSCSPLSNMVATSSMWLFESELIKQTEDVVPSCTCYLSSVQKHEASGYLTRLCQYTIFSSQKVLLDRTALAQTSLNYPIQMDRNSFCNYIPSSIICVLKVQNIVSTSKPVLSDTVNFQPHVAIGN